MISQEQKKLDKKARDKLDKISKHIRVQWSIGQIRNLGDYLNAIGKSQSGYFESELNKLLTYPEVKELLSDLHIELETAIFLRDNPPCIEPSVLQSSVVGQSFTISEIPPENKEEVKESLKEELENYGLIESPNENVSFFWFQKKAIMELYNALVLEHNHGKALVASVGTGKTFILGGLLRRLVDIKWHKQIGSISPWPYIYITKASIVEQTKRVLKQYFNLGPKEVLVINIDQLRSKAGELWIDEKLIVDGGTERVQYSWRPFIHPCLIVWDECQVLKNSGSIQHQIGAAFNDIDEDQVYQIFSSATPFTRVCEAKCFAVSTRVLQTEATIQEQELTNKIWPLFARQIANPADPIEHSPAAIDRLMDRLDKYIVRVKGVKPQFHAKNSVLTINFSSEEGLNYYNKTVERFIKKKQKLDSKFNNGTISAGAYNISKLVAMLQYRIAAEGNPDRILYIATEMYKTVSSRKYSAVGAFNFKGSIIKLVKLLIETFGVSRDDISLIWGGGPQTVSKKVQDKKMLEENDEVMEALKLAGISMEDLALDDVDTETMTEDNIPESYRLGTQTMEARQKEIDRFQSGKSKYCFYTFRAGGVGLSLHHSDELVTEWNASVEGYLEWLKDVEEWNRQHPDQFIHPGKLRRKESGYYYEDDIPFCITRPRKTWVAPTWSAIELVQGLGRVPRLTSLSDTEQYLIFFKGTIEDRVARIVGHKLHCLTKVVRQKESWEDVIIEGKSEVQIEKDYMQVKDLDIDKDELIGEPNEDE